jgi:hypothetical protein
VIKDRVAVIVFNYKEAKKLSADIKEKIACAESSGMAGQREYDCDNPPRKIPYYRLRPIHFGH